MQIFPLSPILILPFLSFGPQILDMFPMGDYVGATTGASLVVMMLDGWPAVCEIRYLFAAPDLFGKLSAFGTDRIAALPMPQTLFEFLEPKVELNVAIVNHLTLLSRMVMNCG